MLFVPKASETEIGKRAFRFFCTLRQILYDVFVFSLVLVNCLFHILVLVICTFVPCVCNFVLFFLLLTIYQVPLEKKMDTLFSGQ